MASFTATLSPAPQRCRKNGFIPSRIEARHSAGFLVALIELVMPSAGFHAGWTMQKARNLAGLLFMLFVANIVTL